MMLSVILPAYNECNRLESSVDRLNKYLSENFTSFEIIIAEDHSTDGSDEIARRISEKNTNVILLHNAVRLGRGASLGAAIKKTRGEYVVYMDVDMATKLGCLNILVLSLANGASVSTGSRWMKGSRVKRPFSRRFASKYYNLLVRLLFGSKIHDHQCGFKGFNRKDILEIVGLMEENHWMWDTELLVLCQRAGLKIFEFPVSWEHNGGNELNTSKVNVLKDSISMGYKLLKLKYRLSVHRISYKGAKGQAANNEALDESWLKQKNMPHKR
jgi:glycosyltransferase involved in cell wall biosynthesis